MGWKMSILDRDRRHEFLEAVDNSHNSFIANINKLAGKISEIQEINEKLPDKRDIPTLLRLAELDLQSLIDDLKKGACANGARKIDVTLPQGVKRIKVTLGDGTSYEKQCRSGANEIVVTTAQGLLEQFEGWAVLTSKWGDTALSVVDDKTLRFADGSEPSEVSSVTLTYADNSTDEVEWGDTTSALLSAAQRLGPFMGLLDNMDEMQTVSKYIGFVQLIAGEIETLQSLVENLQVVNKVGDNIDKLGIIADAINVLVLDLKANKIEKVVTQYSNTYDIGSTNFTRGVLEGDTLTNGEITMRVTGVDRVGMITSFVCTPIYTTKNITGVYTLQKSNASIEVAVTSTPYQWTYNRHWDLQDTYDALNERMDRLLNGIIAVKNRMTIFQKYIDDTAATLATSINSIRNDLNGEISLREQGDTALGTRITNELAQEAADRSNADTALGTRITTETNARTAEDTRLAGLIETTLTTNLNTEIQARIDGDTALRNAVNALNTRTTTCENTLHSHEGVFIELFKLIYMVGSYQIEDSKIREILLSHGIEVPDNTTWELTPDYVFNFEEGLSGQTTPSTGQEVDFVADFENALGG